MEFMKINSNFIREVKEYNYISEVYMDGFSIS